MRLNRLIKYRNYGRLWKVYGRSVIRYSSARKIINAVRTEYAYRRRRVDVRSRPYLLFVEPLYACNLECPLCQRQSWDGARTEGSNRLSLDTFQRVLDEIGDTLYQCHIFGLGEPLMAWKLTRRVIEMAHAKRVFTLLSTNCTILTPQIAEELVASGLDHLVCAIDGVSQEAYSAYRRGGEAAKAIENMRTLVAEKRRQNSRLTIEWQYLVHRYNEHELETARRIADELGIFFRPSPIGGTEWEPALQEDWLPQSPEFRRRRVPVGEPANDYHCYWLWRGAVLNSNGRLARCPGYQNVAEIGDVDTQDIMSIYNGPDARAARELFTDASGRADFPTPCTTCSHYRRKRGGPYTGSIKSCGDATFVPVERLISGRARPSESITCQS